MLTNSTQLTGCQVGHVDLVGKSNVCGIMVKGVAVAKPIELEGEVNCATDGRCTEHGLQNVRLRTRTELQIINPCGIFRPMATQKKSSKWFCWE